MADRSSYMNSDDMKLKQPGIASLSGGNYVDTATEVVKRMMPGMTFRMVDDHYVGESGISHVYFRQTMHGMDIDNSDFNVNVSLTKPPHSFISNQCGSSAKNRLAKTEKSFPLDTPSTPALLLIRHQLRNETSLIL